MIPLEPNLLEEGISLHLAQRMMQGEHLFRDLASFTGPFPFELLTLLFRALGDDIFVARGAVAVMHGLACGAAYALAHSARRDGFAHVAAAFVAAAPVLLFPLFSLYFYSLVALHLALAAPWATRRGDDSPR
jgi:predicted membrane-bound mannosyltransferase